MTLDQLPQLYAAARVTAASAPTVREPQPGVCRYCRRFWRPWPATRHATLDGHAKCVVGPEFRAELTRAWWADPTLTISAIATACDVSVSTVACWLGRKRK